MEALTSGRMRHVNQGIDANGDFSEQMNMLAPVRVRLATLQDADAVAAIYNDGIRGRAATFETQERTASDIRAWYHEPYPFMVAELQAGDGELETVGWVRASPYRPRECYAGIAEFSVYVAAAARGKLVGDTLMAAFMLECASVGFWKIVSRIFPENAASRALCARHGFREVGTYEKHAQLDGRWRDVVIVERLFRGNLASTNLASTNLASTNLASTNLASTNLASTNLTPTLTLYSRCVQG